MTVSSVCVTRELDIQLSVTGPVAAVACCQKTMFCVRLIVSPCQCVSVCARRALYNVLCFSAFLQCE